MTYAPGDIVYVAKSKAKIVARCAGPDDVYWVKISRGPTIKLSAAVLKTKRGEKPLPPG